MTLQELDTYFRSFLKIENFSTDPSLNGIQIENSDPCTKEIKKVAFAVDACQATFDRAVQLHADLLFVHHGIFWGQCETVTGTHYRRLKTLLDNDVALYACHIPLDANELVGNNYGLARRLGLQNIQAFGVWHGMTLGAAGEFEESITIDKLERMLFPQGEKALHILPFGKKEIKTVAIISGGAGGDMDQAVAAGYDAYITGEIGHEEYHKALESKINLIAGGHYQTETVGVSLVMEKLAQDTGLETVFIHVPTGL